MLRLFILYRLLFNFTSNPVWNNVNLVFILKICKKRRREENKNVCMLDPRLSPLVSILKDSLVSCRGSYHRIFNVGCATYDNQSVFILSIDIM